MIERTGKGGQMENPERPGTPEGMSEADVAERSLLATYLGKEIWPATKAEIIEQANNAHAPEEVLSRFEQLPDQRFTNMADMWSVLGGDNEHHRN